MAIEFAKKSTTSSPGSPADLLIYENSRGINFPSSSRFRSPNTSSIFGASRSECSKIISTELNGCHLRMSSMRSPSVRTTAKRGLTSSYRLVWTNRLVWTKQIHYHAPTQSKYLLGRIAQKLIACVINKDDETHL